MSGVISMSPPAAGTLSVVAADMTTVARAARVSREEEERRMVSSPGRAEALRYEYYSNVRDTVARPKGRAYECGFQRPGLGLWQPIRDHLRRVRWPTHV